MSSMQAPANPFIFSGLHLTPEGSEFIPYFCSWPSPTIRSNCWNGYFFWCYLRTYSRPAFSKNFWRGQVKGFMFVEITSPECHLSSPLGESPLGNSLIFSFSLSSFSDSSWAIQLVSPVRPLMHFSKGVLGKLETQIPPLRGCQGLVMWPQLPQPQHLCMSSYYLSQTSKESYVPLLFLEFMNFNCIFLFFVSLEKSVLIHRSLNRFVNSKVNERCLYCVLKLLHFSLLILG